MILASTPPGGGCMELDSDEGVGVTAVEDMLVLDFPLQLLIGIVAALIFHRRGDRLWIALVKGFLVSLVATIVLSVVLWVTS